jgi:hypothetical protein
MPPEGAQGSMARIAGPCMTIDARSFAVVSRSKNASARKSARKFDPNQTLATTALVPRNCTVLPAQLLGSSGITVAAYCRHESIKDCGA